MIKILKLRLKESQSTKKDTNMKLELNDGTTMSVQANRWCYCTPRVDGANEYTAVEIGFPNKKIDLLMPYVEDASNPTDTVYAWVPTTVVAQVISNAGGVKSATNNYFKMADINIPVSE